MTIGPEPIIIMDLIFGFFGTVVEKFLKDKIDLFPYFPGFCIDIPKS
jgi:hypothetical protein